MKYNSLAVKSRILAMFDEKKVKAYKILPEIGLSKNTLDGANKSMPKADTLAVIADYLDCSTDYLLGRTEIPTINGDTHFSGENHNGIQATVNTGNLTVNNEQKLEELETVLLDTFRTFKPTEKVKIVCDLVKKAEKNSPTAKTADE